MRTLGESYIESENSHWENVVLIDPATGRMSVASFDATTKGFISALGVP